MTAWRARLAAMAVCAACGPPGAPTVDIEATPPAITCRHGADSERKWDRSLEWVIAHSHWRVREATATLITTEGPGTTAYPAITVRRFPSPRGTDRIVLEAGCSPERVSVVVDHGRGRPGRAAAPAPDVKMTECVPSLPSLEDSFRHFVIER